MAQIVEAARKCESQTSDIRVIISVQQHVSRVANVALWGAGLHLFGVRHARGFANKACKACDRRGIGTAVLQPLQSARGLLHAHPCTVICCLSLHAHHLGH